SGKENMADTIKFYRRNLPHWLVTDHSYFVTIRLKGTLPKEIVAEHKQEREQLRTSGADRKLLDEARRRQFRKLEQMLDSLDQEKRWLDNCTVAAMVMENLEWLRGRGWKIYAATVLSTHIHLLMRNEEGSSAGLLDDLGQYKSHTAKLANTILGRSGPFWAREQFDHWIRSREKFESTLRYIVLNPVKAHRAKAWRDWPWTVVDEAVHDLLPE
ncbi:MAG: hypothetical protein ABFR47_08455, partial [Verrucomicrobiota bacterium]